jgi:transposase InsO family protein
MNLGYHFFLICSLSIISVHGNEIIFLLNAEAAEAFYTLREAKVFIERWQQEYNIVRPHNSLNYQPLAL